MKVLFTVSTYFPKKDGVAIVTKYLAEGLAQKGYDVTIVTSSVDNTKKNEVYNGVKIIRINLYTRAGMYFGNKQEYLDLIQEESKKTDIMINICTQNAFTDLLLKNIKKYKCNKMLYMHGMFNFNFTRLDFSSLESMINKFWKEIRWAFYYTKNAVNFKKYDKIIQLHDKDDGYIFFKKYYKINSAVIENSTDDMFFEKNEDKTFIKPLDKYLIYVGNYNDAKNQKLAIKEFYKSNIDNRIGLICIGSKKNGYYNKLQKLINRLRKKYCYSKEEKNVLLLSNIERNQIPLYIKNSELFLMTSKVEKYPIALIETMACGVPFLTTDVGIAKYLPGGVISKEKEIHNNIEKLINSPEILKKLGIDGKKYAMKHSMKKEKIEILDKYINEIVGAKNEEV